MPCNPVCNRPLRLRLHAACFRFCAITAAPVPTGREAVAERRPRVDVPEPEVRGVPSTTPDDRSPRPVAETSGGGPDAASVGSTAAALEAALHARAPELYAGTPLVRKLARRVGRDLGLDASEAMLLDACAQVRDIGMIGMPDSVILNTGPLSPDEWASVNRHPELGAEMLRSLSGMAAVAR